MSKRHLCWVVVLYMSLQTLVHAQDEDQQSDPPKPGVEVQNGAEDDLPDSASDEEHIQYVDGEIIVTATRHKESLREISAAAIVVGQQEILERNPRTAAETLRQKPGIWVQKTGHFGGAPILRGFMGNRVIYLFDGIRRNTAGLFAGPNSFLQNIDALDINKVEVIRGPGSVLYGSDAIGGVINVISNENPIFEQSPRLGGRLFGRVATVDDEWSRRGEIFYTDPDLYGFLGVSARDIEDLKGGGDVGTQRPSSWNENNWDAQLNYKISEDASLEVFAQDFSRPKGRRYDKPNRTQEDDRRLLGLRFRAQDVGVVEDLEITTYMHDQESFTDEKSFDSKKNDKTFGFEVQGTSYPDDDVRLVYGVHFHRDRVKKSDPQKGRRDPDVTWDNPAAYMLTEWQASEDLKIDFGLRYDRFTLDSKAPPTGKLAPEIQDAIASGALTQKDLELSETDGALTGGLGAIYSLNETFDWVSHVGRAFRAPNQSDLLRFGQFTFGVNVPSPGLDPEESWTVETGFRAHTEDFNGGLTAFHTIVDNAITSSKGTFNGSSFVDINGDGVEDPDEQVFVKKNSTGRLSVTGVEAEARQWFSHDLNDSLVGGRALSWYGNASWIIGNDSGTNEPLSRAFPANATIGLRLDEDRDPSKSHYWMGIDMWMVRRFHRIPSSRSGDSAFLNDPQDKSSGKLRSDGSVPGFSIFNLRGGLEVGKGSTLSFGVENIFDKKYRVKDSRIDGPGRNFVVGLNVRF